MVISECKRIWQVYVWAITKQCGFADGSGQRATHKALEMSYKNPSLKPSDIKQPYAFRNQLCSRKCMDVNGRVDFDGTTATLFTLRFLYSFSWDCCVGVNWGCFCAVFFDLIFLGLNVFCRFGLFVYTQLKVSFESPFSCKFTGLILWKSSQYPIVNRKFSFLGSNYVPLFNIIVSNKWNIFLYER